MIHNTELNKIRLELAQICNQEKELDEEIKNFVEIEGDREREEILASLNSLRDVDNQVESLCLHTEKMGSRIGEGDALSQKVTKRVRQLDFAQHCVKECLQLVDKILDLKNSIAGVRASIKAGNYKAAVNHASVYRNVESLVTVNASDQLLMESAICDLTVFVTSRFEESLAKNKVEEISKYANLFEPLGIAQDGLSLYLQYTSDDLKSTFPSEISSSVKDLVERLTTTFNTTALAIQKNQNLVQSSFASKNGFFQLVKHLHQVCEEEAVSILKKYIKERQLSAQLRKDHYAESSNNPDTMDKLVESLDLLLNELAMIIQHTESYDRFISAKTQEALENSSENILANGESILKDTSATELMKTVQEIAGFYASLENQYLIITAKKALALDRLEESHKCSSCVDEVFYFARNSGLRSLATGHVDSAAAVINFISNVVSEIYLKEMEGRLNKMSKFIKDSSHVQQQVQQHLAKLSKNVQWNIHLGEGGDMTGANESKPSISPLWPEIVLNNLEASYEYSIKLQEQLIQEVPESFQEGVIPNSKLANCLNGFSDTSQAIRTALDHGKAKIRDLLYPRLTSFLQSLVKDIEFDLNEQDYTQYQVNNPFILKIVQTFDSLVLPFEQNLTSTNFIDLLELLIQDIVHQLEKALVKKRYTLLGAIQLDKDKRALLAYFSGKTSLNVKEKFVRLNQICLILTLEHAQDILEYWGKSAQGAPWQFTASEVKALLRLRLEFRQEDISKLILSS